MEYDENIMDELQRPPSKNNLSKYHICELIIIVLIAFCAGKHVFSLFKGGSFSIMDLITLVVELMIFVGFLIFAYAFFTENDELFKKGYQLFFYGCLCSIILWFLNWFRGGFSFSSLIGFILFGLFIYIMFLHIQNL